MDKDKKKESKEKKSKEMKLSTKLNIVASIILAIPILMNLIKDVPIGKESNKYIFGGSLAIFMLGQIIKIKNDDKEERKKKFGNLIAFFIAFILIIFFY